MNIVITGGSNGLGKEIIDSLLLQSFSENKKLKIFNLDISEMEGLKSENLITIVCDVSSKVEVEKAAKTIGGIDILINNAGINGINYLEDVSDEEFDRIMSINAKGIFNTSSAFVESLKDSKGTILNIVSNASHMPMTNSLAYNASKGAAHIMTLQLARELTKKYGITVFGISPNKLAGTEMSKYIDNTVPSIRGWTFEEAKQYQLNGLLAGEETDPKALADFITYLLKAKQNHKYLSGCVLPYGA